ncbi:hypothetical protein MPLSOD_40643 [Mesorhizobium sp. SOD10]|nr:hypothetical protein MPLSOD_40643 [Mesorhizobium sp. SOD10]
MTKNLGNAKPSAPAKEINLAVQQGRAGAVSAGRRGARLSRRPAFLRLLTQPAFDTFSQSVQAQPGVWAYPCSFGLRA